ncbi:Glycosyltransferase family protein (fragment) [Acidobacteriia bacterium SbA2]
MLSVPVVSVVTPAYNRHAVLPRAISSVLAQNLQNWEMIIVDDASTDDTERVVGGFRDSRIRYIRHQSNRGQSAAQNTGAAAARGRFLSFLDSDDEWLPGKLASEVALFESAGERVGLVYSGKVLMDHRGFVVKVRIPSVEGRVHEKLLEWDFIGTCSRVSMRKSILEAVGGFDASLRNCQDWDMWIRVSKLTEVGCIRECQVKRHLGSDQVSGSLRAIIAGKARVLEKHRCEMPPSVAARHLGTLSILLGNYDRQRARQAGREALKLLRFQPTVVAALTASLLGTRPYRFLFSKLAKLRHALYVGRAAI